MSRKLISLTTLGVLVDTGHAICVYCGARGCRHSAWLDLPALAERLGRNHGSMHWDLAPKLRCTACGGKHATLRLHPPTGPFKGIP